MRIVRTASVVERRSISSAMGTGCPVGASKHPVLASRSLLRAWPSCSSPFQLNEHGTAVDLLTVGVYSVALVLTWGEMRNEYPRYPLKGGRDSALSTPE